MNQKSVVLQNRGMNRDLSISKTGESAAYENRNIRIIARDNDTLLSVTNERGTKEISLGNAGIEGTLVGWNVLNNHIILFTHDKDYVEPTVDPDVDPTPPDKNVTFRYKVITTLSSGTVSMAAGDFVVATAIRYKMRYEDGVAVSDWEYDGDVSHLGFRAKTGSEHVGCSGQNIFGISTGMAEIQSRFYASEYVNAELTVTSVVTYEYRVLTYSSRSVIYTREPERTATLSGKIQYRTYIDGVCISSWVDLNDPNYIVDSFTIVSGSEYADFDETQDSNVIKGQHMGGPVVVEGSSGAGTPDTPYDVEYVPVSVMVQSHSGGSSEGSSEEPEPILSPIYYNIEGHFVNDTTVYFDLSIINTGGDTPTLRNVSVSLYKTESPNPESAPGGEIIASYSFGTFTITEPDTLLYGTIVLDSDHAREEGYYYYLHGYDDIHYDSGYWQVGEPEPPEEGGDEPAPPEDTIELPLFTSEPVRTDPDHIYRIDYVDGEFRMVRGNTNGEEGVDFAYDQPLFAGNLGFDIDHPIESVVYEETRDIQKIYWVDGNHVLRFMNFMESAREVVVGEGSTAESFVLMPWETIVEDELVNEVITDNTYFDSNRTAGFGVEAEIEKDNTGNTRANGVVQYLLTYYNKHGQETSYVWVSDLVYLSPLSHGGAADETNNNRVTITFSNLDTSFTNYRVYSVFRSSLNGNTVSYLVSEGLTPDSSEDKITVIDDGAHLVAQDATRLLYLGSQAVVASTLTYKDQTLFLGDLRSIGRVNYDGLEDVIRGTMFEVGAGEFEDGETWESSCVSFEYTNDDSGDYSTIGIDGLSDIPYKNESGAYSYKNQLVYSSGQILTFKGGEKYRFALKFKMQDGTETDAFWIGDKENDKYPVVDSTNGVIKRVVAVCNIPADVVEFLKDTENGKFAAVQLCIAEATYADRSVLAQGIVNPTMFNVWERYNKRNYAIPTWISRPRGIELENRHFSPVHNSINSSGEIQCNYWENTSVTPTPYFRYRNYPGSSKTYNETFIGATSWERMMLVYTVYYDATALLYHSFNISVRIITGDVQVADFMSDLEDFEFQSGNFTDTDWKYVAPTPGDIRSGGYFFTRRDEAGNELYTLRAQIAEAKGSGSFNVGTAISSAYDNMRDVLINKYDIPVNLIVTSTIFASWCNNTKDIGSGRWKYFSKETPVTGFLDAQFTLNYVASGHTPDYRWYKSSEIQAASLSGNYTPSYYKKNLMFVDENIVTLDSPEISYEAVAFDNVELNFRIVGAAKLTSLLTDYTVDATPSGAPGTSLDTVLFTGTFAGRNGNITGLTSWPLWREYGLQLKADYDKTSYSLDDRTSDHYFVSNNIVRYWLYMWQHSGSISGYNFSEEEDRKLVDNASVLERKIIANQKYSYNTVYLADALDEDNIVESEGVRLVNQLSGSYAITVGGENEYYTGQVQMMLGMPGAAKYPIVFSESVPDTTESELGTDAQQAYMSSNAPVLLEFNSGPHALISLKTTEENSTYKQRILPYFFRPVSGIPEADLSQQLSGALLPWVTGEYPYSLEQDQIDSVGNHTNADSITEADQYLFVGELYKDCGEGSTDTRYGGISLSAVKNNRFIAAGPIYPLSEMSIVNGGHIFGNQGDTYFQRWDDLRIKPFSNDSENNVIDIVSAMLETHVNLDGRTDLQRGTMQLASIDTTTFGQVNPVYSQQNNFSVKRDLDADFNLDSYRSSITWTLQKNDMTDVDEWSHITLASTLKLDSDKGVCQALRKFRNSIFAFQDRGISEILFNSRTQLSTNDGIPVEIANSGKVDGKNYITNKYGCLNKWSIIEGKNGIYFVDNINKAFCSLTNAGVDNLSTRLGFSNWFKTRNKVSSWTPRMFVSDVDSDANFVSFYDRVHSDVYLVKRQPDEGDTEAPALVYNELLGAFTSFYDYGSVPMMVNVEDRFISYKETASQVGALWLQNEGAYGDFFGDYKPFWVQYRVTPDPYGDKIWTNVEYRADFYRTLSGSEKIFDDQNFIDDNNAYQPNETFDFMRFWDEYQSTEVDESKYNLSPIKKFRIWRLAIPRAMKSDTNPFGLDRIRNPWLNLIFKKNAPTVTTSQDLMQLHDVTVTYYE